MKFKKSIAAGTFAAAFVSSTLNASAAQLTNGDDYMNALKADGQNSLIIDVEAYKAAYSDLAAAFGDDWGAYIEHYLTYGVYEGRTEGVLFDPLAYAEAYSDIKAAYGDNILAIANHYKTVGIAENRTIGTANGYVDIATAKKAEAEVIIPKVNSQENVTSVNNRIEDNKENTYDNDDSGRSNVDTNKTKSDSVSNVVESNSVVIFQNNNVEYIEKTSSNAANTNVNTNSDTDTGNTSTNVAAANSSADNGNNYQHVTSIYHDDGETLWRKEYYDENNKLSEYSSVTNVDNSTNSYTENIYKWDYEKNEEVLQRTDTYMNGELVSSERP